MSEHQLETVRRKTRLRLLFSGAHLILYFSFALNWTEWGQALRAPLGDSPITGSVLMFCSLIVFFVGMEFLFFFISQRNEGHAS